MLQGTRLEPPLLHTHLTSLGVSRAGSPQPPDLYPPPCPSTVHLWRFSGGYPALMDCMNKLKNNKVCWRPLGKALRMLVLAQPCAGGCLRQPVGHTDGAGALPGCRAQTTMPAGVPGVPKGAEPDAAVQEEPAAPRVQLLERATA